MGEWFDGFFAGLHHRVLADAFSGGAGVFGKHDRSPQGDDSPEMLCICEKDADAPSGDRRRRAAKE